MRGDTGDVLAQTIAFSTLLRDVLLLDRPQQLEEDLVHGWVRPLERHHRRVVCQVVLQVADDLPPIRAFSSEPRTRQEAKYHFEE
jgi:hypothetical protein